MARKCLILMAICISTPAFAQFDQKSLENAAKSAGQSAAEHGKAEAKKEADKNVEQKVNQKLLSESRKNQCAFKTNSDQFQGKCDDKVKKLFNDLVDAKKTLVAAGVSGFKFEVSGHTDTRGDPAKNKALSEKRAARIVAELKKKGIPENEIIAVGKGSEEPLVKPDNTPEKQKKNRRYEIRVRLQMPS